MKLSAKQTNAISIAIAVMQAELDKGLNNKEVEYAIDELIKMRDENLGFRK